MSQNRAAVNGEQSFQWRSQIERAGRCNFSQRVYIVLTAIRGLDLLGLVDGLRAWDQGI